MDSWLLANGQEVNEYDNEKISFYFIDHNLEGYS